MSKKYIFVYFIKVKYTLLYLVLQKNFLLGSFEESSSSVNLFNV